MVRVAVLLIAVLVLLSISPGSSQTSYTSTTVQCSGTQVNVSGISSAASSSEIVGQWLIRLASHAYYARVNGSSIGTCTNIDPAGATYARAIGINEINQIVGPWEDSSGRYHGFTYNPTSTPVWWSFDIPGTNNPAPNGINGNGVIVGDYLTGGVRYGFVVTTSIVNNAIVPDNDAVTGITFQAGTSTNINGVNTAFNGKTYFVGDSGYGEHGFWGTITVSAGPSISVSPLTRFDCQGATYTRPLGVDNNGLMVGRVAINKTNYAFTASFNGTTFSPICNTSYPVQPSKDTAFTGSNASTGQLVGFSGSAQGGFLLTPSLP
jgi:hypothetical protein